MSFSQFIKPYPDGYEDFEAGDTPVTAEILNTNYDGFLLALNNFLTSLESSVDDKVDKETGKGLSEENYTSTEKNKLSGIDDNATEVIANPSGTSSTNLTKISIGGSIYMIPSGGSGGSSVSWEQLQSTGTKIATITIDNVPVDVYAPSGGGSGDEVSWTQTLGSGTEIGTITINGTPITVYAPTPIDVEANPSGSATAGDLTKLKVGSSIYSIPSGGSGHTIIDENGNSMSARAGLQFVGANVSDDATNNKTIVDLASEGGIDGVFLDTDNVIYNQFTFDSTAHTWTATEDCILAGNLVALDAYTGAYIWVDNVTCFNTYENTSGNGFYIPIKRGQTITYRAKSGATNNEMSAYGIQTGTTHSKFQPVIYSTEEREIGVWTDGKPLYAKTFEFDSTDLQSETYGKYIDLTINNIEKVCLSTIMLEDGMLELPYYQSSSLYITAFPILSTNKCAFKFRYGSDVASYLSDYFANSKIILYYTKSTDTAGSGSWTPQGVPTVHYSAEEQVIGTWFGETLYQKSYEIASLPSSAGYADTSLGLSNISVKHSICDIYFSNGSTRPAGALMLDNDGTLPDMVSQISYSIMQNSYIRIVVGTNRSAVSAMVTIQYTKSS